jgi:hypothetical protein
VLCLALGATLPTPPWQALLPEASRFCACDPGWGSWGCQQQLLSLPLNAAAPITADIPPGKWAYWEVVLPPARGGSSSSGSSGSSGSEQLLLTAERLPSPGMGGNPLLFLKPFGTKVCGRRGHSWR